MSNIMLTKKIERNFAIASGEASLSEMAHRMGSCLVSGGKVISKGHNSSRARVSNLNRSVRSSLHNHSGNLVCPSIHAEIDALRMWGRLCSSQKKSCHQGHPRFERGTKVAKGQREKGYLFGSVCRSSLVY